jgi:ABC-type thiamin/hydroxymethylpyrimidine transport system permease subunit
LLGFVFRLRWFGVLDFGGSGFGVSFGYLFLQSFYLGPQLLVLGFEFVVLGTQLLRGIVSASTISAATFEAQQARAPAQGKQQEDHGSNTH